MTVLVLDAVGSGVGEGVGFIVGSSVGFAFGDKFPLAQSVMSCRA